MQTGILARYAITVPGKRGIEEMHIDPATGAVLGREHENPTGKTVAPTPKTARPER
jgi:hypothetical protein